MKSVLKIGLVGVGGMGKVHYANYQKIPDCQVAAVCGSSRRARDTAGQWGVPCFDTVTAMTRSCDLDVVDICTPTYTHHDLVMESLACGRHVICEKPIALSTADAREMLDEAQRRGLGLYIAQVLQFTKEVQALRRVTESGEYGKPLDACFERLSACPRWAQDGWLFDGAKSGLLPYDLHIHDLDVIVSVFGRPQGFRLTSCQGPERTYPEQIRIDYDFGGFHVNAESAWFHADIPWTARWRVYYEDGMLINDGNSLVAYPFEAEPRVFDTADEVVVSTGINVPPCGWFYTELSHFLSCIRSGGVPTPWVSRDQLLTVMEILEEVSAPWRKK